MKKLYIILTAALSVALVSCQKELLDGVPQGEGSLRTLTVSFDESSTKTNITNQGKTVWAEGDVIWVSNGTDCDTLTVAAASAGSKYCEFTTSLQGKLYVVYPCSAAKGLTGDGKILLNIPSVQNGQFGSANISAAVVEGESTKVKMKSITTILKFRVPTDAEKPVKIVSINTADNRAAGTFSVDLSSGTPVIATADTVTYSTDISVKVDGLSGNFYATLLPGTYGAGFSMTAVGTNLKYAYQSKTSTVERTLVANELYDLGRIGDELKSLEGDGSKGNPWQVGSFPEMLALAYYVNDGYSMRDQYVKLTNDISNVSTPIGIYNGDNDVINYPFQGNFDGNDKTVTVNINMTSDRSAGLFAFVKDSAYIHNVKVAGKVYSEYGKVGSLIGYMSATNASIKVENCSSSASLTGAYEVAGLVGRASGTATKYISNSSFSGSASSKYTTAGVVAYSYYTQIVGCSNTGTVATSESNGGAYSASRYNASGSFGANWVRGTGGIVGWLQNGTAKDCTNSGNISAYNKVGGIVGSSYWSSTLACSNSGKITTSGEAGVMGGILGWIMTTGNVYNCVNTGDIVATGNAAWVGGIAGYSTPESRKYYTINFARCENKGTVTSEKGSCIGGIIGNCYTMSNLGDRTMIYYCTNSGKVSSDSSSYVAGIVGYLYDGGAYTLSVVDGCANSGSITAAGCVGGIIGYFNSYSVKALTTVRNCENTGDILSTKEGDNDYAGGIAGYQRGNLTSGAYGLHFYNCRNTGSVLYTGAAHKTPYVGGIIGGKHVGGSTKNCYNGGKVGLKEGEGAVGAGKYIGAISGYEASNGFECCYFTAQSATDTISIAGTASTKVGTNLSAVQSDGTLATPVTISSIQYANVVDALNAWIGSSTAYYKWTSGPKFVQPSYTDQIDGGGFDLGNGGEI